MKFFYTLAVLMLSLACYSQAPTIKSTYGVTGDCTGVVYGNGIYVANANLITELSAVFTSVDARIWTPVPFDNFPPGGFHFLAFGNGVFIGVSSTWTIYSSTDGTNWAADTSLGPDGIADLRFLNGAFYAVGGSAPLMKSTDGIHWGAVSLGIPLPGYLHNIAYGGGVFVIEAAIPMNQTFTDSTGFLRSTTGEPGSWTLVSYPGLSPNDAKLIWLKDRFFHFAGGGFLYSTDGANWLTVTAPLIDTLLDGTVSTINELYSPAGFTAGDSVYLFGYNSLGGTYSMYVSADGNHYKQLPTPDIGVGGGLYVNGLYIVYGGGIGISTDGVHYKSNSTSFAGFARNGSGYVAVGGNHMFSSPDFVNWTDRTPDTAIFRNITGLAYSGTRYVAGGTGGNSYFSDDGMSWSTVQVPYSFLSMGYGAGRFVAGSNDDVNYMLTSSTDGINWSVVDTNYSYYNKVRYLNNNFYAMGLSYRDLTGRIMQSADGLHWNDITPAAGFPVFQYTDVIYDGTKYYFTGEAKGPDNAWIGFFTLSTANPMDTLSYGAAGSIVNPASGTSAGDYFVQFQDFVYYNHQFVGTVSDRINFLAYLAYSSDGMNWTTTPLNGPEQARALLVDGDTLRIVGDDGGRYSVSFAGSPLPVTLFDFEAMVVASGSAQNSRLSWRTGSESNSAYFLVQHSPDAVRWDSIGRVTAAGESSVTKTYQFTQVGPPAGANYYRLGLTDRDGRRQWSPVRQVNIGDEGDIRLYPNPAKGVVQLQLPESGPASLFIYNSSGMLVWQQVVSGYSAAPDLRLLAAGTYHLLVFQGGKRYNKEFVIAE